MSAASRRYTTDLNATGEPFLWGLGGALALGVLLVVGFLVMIFWNGAATFWPKPIHVVTLNDGGVVAGEPTRDNVFQPGAELLEKLTEGDREAIEANSGFAHRVLYRTGNYDIYNEDFRWVSDFAVEKVETPSDMYLFERQEWGVFVGRIAGVTIDGKQYDIGGYGYGALQEQQTAARERFNEIRHIEREEIGAINHYIEEARLDLKRVALDHEEGSAEYRQAERDTAQRIAELEKEYEELAARADAIKEEDRRYRITLEEIGGREKELPLSQIVRFYPANDLSGLDKAGIYLSRWGEFLTAEPREANTEGGVLPAIFGTVAMTLIMVIFVAPLGVITALYLREYAKQGRLVSMVRISVNNLAGVPSIVYGVFGLGFFAYTLGGGIDALFFPERLPSPTFGTGGILWASLTLALLTVPVVIVASEEALSAVPRSMREGSLACGASTWQTLRFVVLPRAMPGIMTGLILAMARGAGEVAPLMLVGVVKLAPELPIDGFFPFVHLERSFMHLGFHIFDVGFQSRNSEAGKPMVYVTTMLLLALIVLMNASAIYIRNRLKKKYAGGTF
ncbi:MAG: phosphate ABC transporter permease PstA [Gammaproteobacteria bacterium]|nr:phosphate ABC transporter permease PstA [Gammaproteobacteria bacterium]